MTVIFDRSMTVAPTGTARLAPTALIRSPSITMTWLGIAVPVSGSNRRPALMTVTGSGFAAGGIGACWAATPTTAARSARTKRVTTRRIHDSSFAARL